MLNLNLKNAGGAGGGTPEGTYKVAQIPFLKGLNIGQTGSSRANMVVKHPSDANKVVIIHCATGTTINFYTYDFVTKVVTELTQSGVSVVNTSTPEYPEAVIIGTTIYFYNKTSTGTNYVYTYTISGTTITQGTSLDISSNISTSDNHYTKMATDGTYLYFYEHNGASDVFHRYSTAGAYTAMANPATNFYSASGAVQLFGRGTDKIYAFGGYDNSHGLLALEEYDVSANTWTLKGLSSFDTQGVAYGVCCDQENEDSPIYYISSNRGLYEIDPTDGSETYLGGGDTESNIPYVVANTGSGQYMTVFYFDSTNNRMILPTSENGVFADMTPYLAGQFEVSGRGTFVGADTSSSDATNRVSYHRMSIQVDGGAWIPIIDYQEPVGLQSFRIPFTTSLKVRNNIHFVLAPNYSTYCHAHYYQES